MLRKLRIFQKQIELYNKEAEIAGTELVPYDRDDSIDTPLSRVNMDELEVTNYLHVCSYHSPELLLL